MSLVELKSEPHVFQLLPIFLIGQEENPYAWLNESTLSLAGELGLMVNEDKTTGYIIAGDGTDKWSTLIEKIDWPKIEVTFISEEGEEE